MKIEQLVPLAEALTAAGNTIVITADTEGAELSLPIRGGLRADDFLRMAKLAETSGFEAKADWANREFPRVRFIERVPAPVEPPA